MPEIAVSLVNAFVANEALYKFRRRPVFETLGDVAAAKRVEAVTAAESDSLEIGLQPAVRDRAPEQFGPGALCGHLLQQLDRGT